VRLRQLDQRGPSWRPDYSRIGSKDQKKKFLAIAVNPHAGCTGFTIPQCEGLGAIYGGVLLNEKPGHSAPQREGVWT